MACGDRISGAIGNGARHHGESLQIHDCGDSSFTTEPIPDFGCIRLPDGPVLNTKTRASYEESRCRTMCHGGRCWQTHGHRVNLTHFGSGSGGTVINKHKYIYFKFIRFGCPMPVCLCRPFQYKFRQPTGS